MSKTVRDCETVRPVKVSRVQNPQTVRMVRRMGKSLKTPTEVCCHLPSLG